MITSGAIPDTVRRGTRVLVDKDGALTQLPPPACLPAQPPPETVIRSMSASLPSAAFSAATRRAALAVMPKRSNSAVSPDSWAFSALICCSDMPFM